jgi:DNA-binding MarR family transcriptional regulator
MRDCAYSFLAFDTQWRVQLGLSANEKSLITHLWASESATMSELAARTGLTSGGITSIVDRLEREGYIERRGDPLDRRKLQVVLTERGRSTREALDEALANAADVVEPAAALHTVQTLTAHFEAAAERIRAVIAGGRDAP